MDTSSLILPAIQPACTVDAPLCLLADIFSAVFALHLPLHNVVSTCAAVGHCNDPQTQCDEQKPQDLVQERAPCQHQCSVVQCLLNGVVAGADGAIVVRPFVKYSELLIEITTEEREQRDNRKDNVGHEGVGASGECSCESDGVSIAPNSTVREVGVAFEVDDSAARICISE